MTEKHDPRPLRRALLFSAIEQAAAPTVELGDLVPKNEEADKMANRGDPNGIITDNQEKPHKTNGGQSMQATK
jgi:hypothetical protein